MQRYKSGNTPLVKIADFCEKFDTHNLFIKDESKNPFGTFKDRRSEFILMKALDEHVEKIVLITSGNAGFSLAKFAQGTALKIVSVVDESLPSAIHDQLNSVCYRVIKVDLRDKILKPEEIIAMVREKDKETIWDATNGYHEAYESIIDEIKGKKPDIILSPLGSGEAFVGLYNGIKKNKLNTKLIGVMPEEIPSFADKLFTPWTPYASKIKSITRFRKHKLIRISERDIKSSYSFCKSQIKCEPSSSIVFAALPKINYSEKDKIIAVNSGRALM